MAQSLTRQMKRGHVVPVFNPISQSTDFYKKIRNSGNYRLTSPYSTNHTTGSDFTSSELQKLKQKGIDALKQLQEKDKPGFFKRMFGLK